MPRIVLPEGASVHCAIDDYLWPWDDKMPVLMMHGFARNVLFWNRWVPAIAETHRIYRPDLLGCGLSDQPPREYQYTPNTIAAQILAVLDALSLSRVHWVGESSGGLIGLLLAAAHPERVASLGTVQHAIAHSGSHQAHLRAGPRRRRGSDLGTWNRRVVPPDPWLPAGSGARERCATGLGCARNGPNGARGRGRDALLFRRCRYRRHIARNSRPGPAVERRQESDFLRPAEGRRTGVAERPPPAVRWLRARHQPSATRAMRARRAGVLGIFAVAARVAAVGTRPHADQSLPMADAA